MDRRRPRKGAFTGFPFTGDGFEGYPFTGVKFGEDTGTQPFALIYKGAPSDYTSYTRLGLSYAEDPSGDPVTVAQDVAPYEYVDGVKVARFYAGTGILPFPPGTNVTVSPATSSMLAEDVDTSCYDFSNAGNETVNTGLLKQALTSVSFDIRLRTTNGDVITQCPKDTSDAIAAVTSGAGYAINFSHDGTDYVTDTELNFNTSYLIELTDAGVLSVDGTPDTLSAGASIAFSSTDILFGSRGSDLHIDGYMWNVKYYDTSGMLAWYKCDEYRQDILSPDSSGNSNDGTIVGATLAAFRVENQGFGYPVNEKAELPWSYTTDDGVRVRKGLREFFGGEARGVLVSLQEYAWANINGGSFTKDGEIFTVSGGGSTQGMRTTYLTVINGYIEFKIDCIFLNNIGAAPMSVNVFDPSFTLMCSYALTVGENTFRCKVSGSAYVFFYVSGNGSCEVTQPEFRLVSQAVGSIPIKKYTARDLSTIQPFLKFTTDDFVPFYLDTDGYIKATDGTNTCVAPTVLTAGTELPEAWLSFNGDDNEMWISFKDASGVITKGPVSPFTGYFPDVGQRLYGMTSGEYQTIEELGFENPVNGIPYGSSLLTSDGAAFTLDGVEITSNGTKLTTNP